MYEVSHNMKQIHITLSSKTPVPYDYQYELYSSFQSKIGGSFPQISRCIHESKGVPLLNMSALLPIGFEGRPSWPNARSFALYINTTRNDVAEAFLSSLPVGFALALNSCMLTVISIKVAELSFDRVTVLPELKSRGPIVVRENNRYFRVGDVGFEGCLISALKRKADIITGKNTVVRGLKIVTEHRKMYSISGHSIPASIISFILDADEDVIRTALVYGVGSKTQMGFGMVTCRD